MLNRFLSLIPATLLPLIPLGCDTENPDGETGPSTTASTGSETEGPTDCDDDPPFCLQACGSDIEIDAVCEDGAWTCGDGADPETCETACTGPSPTCLEACGSDIALDDPFCSEGAWMCDEGVVSDECPDPCPEPAPSCVMTCDDDESYPAICGDAGWSCGEGVPQESC